MTRPRAHSAARAAEETTMEFQKGDRVFWQGRPATVVYRRNGPPDFSRAEAYSIWFDGETRRNYSGTVVPAVEVQAVRS